MIMTAVLGAMIPMFAVETSAQTYLRSRKVTRTYLTRTNKKPSFYRRHRNLINIGIGTGAGALIGGLVGGKKGALIGTAVGAGGSALYTYKINPKKTRYYRNYRRY